MTLKNKINKIINSDTSIDKGLLIIQLLEEENLSLDGNGYLDDDEDSSEALYSKDLMAELDYILKL